MENQSLLYEPLHIVNEYTDLHYHKCKIRYKTPIKVSKTKKKIKAKRRAIKQSRKRNR